MHSSRRHLCRTSPALHARCFSYQLTSSAAPRHPAYTYDQLLENCLQLCKQVKAHHPFDETPHRVSTISTIGKIIHGYATKLGFSSERFLGNAILDLYTKCGNVDFAEKAFDRLENKDVFAWNSVLSLYLKLSSSRSVTRSFGVLWNEGVRPNEYTFAIALSACARLGSEECGSQVHNNLVKMGLEPSSFSQGALIDMYAKSNQMTEARKVFDAASKMDIVSWTSLIAGYVQAGLPGEATQIFEEMQKDGLEPDQVTLITVLNAYLSLGKLDDASKLFFQISNPNVVAWNVIMAGHAKRGYEAEAVEFFQKMRKSGVKSTRSTLGSILSAVGNLASLHLGLLLHGEAMKLGLYSNVYVGSSLISMYGKCAKPEAAKKVFDDLQVKNLVLWNSMLGGFAQNDYPYEVVELFFNMKSYGFQPDDFTFTSILSACACLELLEVGRQLHSVIIKNKLASNLFVGNALVDMYAKSGNLEDARQQFELVKNKDNVSWNAIIVGYVQEGNEDEAFKLFRLMNVDNILPDEVSLASILSACASVKGLEQGKQVHCLSVKTGLETGLYAGSSLIDMYVKCGNIESAHKILACLPKWSVVSVNALIAGYASCNLEKTVLLFRKMQVEGLKPSEVTLATILEACDGPEKTDLGIQIHCLLIKTGLPQYDEYLAVSLLSMYMSALKKREGIRLFSELSILRSTIFWTAMISGLTQNDCSEEALQFYQKMHCSNIVPDQAVFVSVLKACALLSSMRDGTVIHALICRTGLASDELTCSALVDMYAKCGNVESSMQVFEELASKENVISWNSMIVGFAKNGYAEDALRVFWEMKHMDVKPDEITFLCVLTACNHAGMVPEGRHIFDMMVNHYGIQPRIDHCACMVDLLGRWGFLEEAEEFISKLNLESDGKIWATMLAACRTHGDEKRGQKAAEKLIQLDPQNSSPYVLLSNIHAASGNWEEVKTLRRSMKEKGLKKLPGCSWITVRQTTDFFVAGEVSHPSADGIGLILKDLTAVMKDMYFSPLDFLDNVED
ncbi:Pentatricopeptide repeat-containing protein At3g09040, mitochondrial [Linum perenne]